MKEAEANYREKAPKPSAWAPFRYSTFSVLWIATVVSNIGTWMNDVASGWLMTSLSPSPLMVALVQVATTAPIFMFALGAGVVSDLFDRRRLLIVVTIILGLLAAGFGVLVELQIANPAFLLAFTFLSGAGAAFVAPTWQAIVPQLVARTELSSAVALNGIGINVARAIGPALAGAVIASIGISWPYLLNAMSYLVVLGALVWWRPATRKTSDLPAERFRAAMRSGLRYARASRPLRDTLVRAIAFFLFASAYWALLPLVARQELRAGPELYGVMLGAVGAGAVGCALILPRIKQRIGADEIVVIGTLGLASILLSLAVVRNPLLAVLASFIAGASWILVLSSLNVSAQLALPDWVRARGLSVFITVFFGSLALGSLIWGQLATMIGIPSTLIVAAFGAVTGIWITRKFKLQQGLGLDLSPSAHWPQPLVTGEIMHERGPVLVTVEYRVNPGDRIAFAEAMGEMEAMRRRNGAYSWGLFQDTAEQEKFLEYFTEESWLSHLYHHERVSEADRIVQERIIGFHRDTAPPRVTHFLAPDAAQLPVRDPEPSGSLQ